MKQYFKYLLLLPLIVLSACVACTDELDVPEQFADTYGIDPSPQQSVEQSHLVPNALVARSIPNVWMKLVNKQVSNDTVIFDVQFKADQSGLRHGGMNVRLFIPFNDLTFLGLFNFAPGYGLMSAGQPATSTGNANSGPILFGVPGPVTYINGAMDLVNASAPPIYMDDWVTLYQIKFKAKTSKGKDCPVIILDKERLPHENGGFLPSDGVTIVYYTMASPSIGAPTTEYVMHWSWVQTKDKYPTFGAPLACPSFR